MRNAEISP